MLRVSPVNIDVNMNLWCRPIEENEFYSFKLPFEGLSCILTLETIFPCHCAPYFPEVALLDVNQSNHSLIGAVCVGRCVCMNTFLSRASVGGLLTTIKHQPLLWFKPCLDPNLLFFLLPYFFPLIFLSFFLSIPSFVVLPLSFVPIFAFFTSNCSFFLFLLLECLDWLMKDLKA